MSSRKVKLSPCNDCGKAYVKLFRRDLPWCQVCRRKYVTPLVRGPMQATQVEIGANLAKALGI